MKQSISSLSCVCCAIDSRRVQMEREQKISAHTQHTQFETVVIEEMQFFDLRPLHKYKKITRIHASELRNG